MCSPRSHRGRCSYRNEAVVGAPAPGANNVLAPFAPRAVLLQERSRGRSTRPGCEYVLARFAPRAVLLQERNRGRSTRLGCEYVLARFTPRAVLLQNQPVVGAPASGANKCRSGANGVARVRCSLDELVLVPLRFLPGTPGHVPACEKMYNGGISRVARGCPVFPDFTSGDSMDTFIQMLRNISPEVYESLKTAVELGKWADGRKLTQEQKELCLQAIIAWEMDNLPEEERTGYIAQSCKNASKAPANLDESLFSAAKGTLH